MKKVEALKNIFQQDNWDEIAAAKEKMYTDRRDAEKEETVAKSTQVSEDDGSFNAKILHLEKKYDEIIKNQNENLQKMIQKINDLILTANRHDETLKNFAQEVKQLKVLPPQYQQRQEPQQRQEHTAPRSQESQQDKPAEKKPLDKPIDRNNVAPADVQIEKVFNFANKKF